MQYNFTLKTFWSKRFSYRRRYKFEQKYQWPFVILHLRLCAPASSTDCSLLFLINLGIIHVQHICFLSGWNKLSLKLEISHPLVFFLFKDPFQGCSVLFSCCLSDLFTGILRAIFGLCCSMEIVHKKTLERSFFHSDPWKEKVKTGLLISPRFCEILL